MSEATNMAHVVVVLKEGLTSRDLVSHARDFDYLKNKIIGYSHTYTNVEGGFSISEFERLIGKPTEYSLQSVDELFVLTNQLARDLSTQFGKTKLVLVTIKESVPTSSLDQIV
jgi:hypothetical protein